MSVATLARTPTAAATIALIGRSVAIEILRRREVHILFFLMVLYVLGFGVMALLGIDNESTSLFLLSLGFAFAMLASHLLTLLTAARQIPMEIENRTLFPLLAKPLSRAQFLLGKWLAVTTAGSICLVALLAMSALPWALAPMPPLDVGCLVQAVICAVCSIAMMAALAVFFSLVIPKGLNVTILGMLYVFGHQLAGLVASRTGGGFSSWLVAYVPSFGKLDLFGRFADGIPSVGMGEFAGMILYAAIATATALVLSVALFQRRSL